MVDKKTLYSFVVTILVIFFIFVAFSADKNSRSLGFGGEMPVHSTLTQEFIHSNDATIYLYRNRTEIYNRIKAVLPPELNLILTFGEKRLKSSVNF